MRSWARILIFGISLQLTWAQTISDNGFLNVNYDQVGQTVYLDGDSIGITPIKNYPLKPGKYSVSLFSSDTIEQKYWQITTGRISSRLSGLWELAKVSVATQRIEIKPNQVTEVNFSLRKINRAPTQAKFGAVCCLGSGFSLAFLLGVLVTNWVK